MHRWIHDFQLFLFDFDGLLVNTEHLHYQAYINALERKGFHLPLSFANFLELAHFDSKAWREAIFVSVPGSEADWDSLYREKARSYLDLVASGKVELMPGVEEVLTELEKAGIRRCVVTHSPLEQTELIRSRLPLLKTIPKWITREEYEKPKPHPECYLKAIELYGKKGDRIIGFEDSIRGLRALQKTPALPVLICPEHHPLLEIALSEGEGVHFEAFTMISKEKLSRSLA